jgi:ketosteroid isomerase-like protein
VAHPNETRFREGYAAFQRGDIEALRNDFFTDDIVWHSPGTHVVHMRDGKVSESWILQEDLYATDEFFS